MAIRLQEMHSALVHLPIALLPLAVGAAAIGRLTDNKSRAVVRAEGDLHCCGRRPGLAVTGLIAGEEVNVESASQDMLITRPKLYRHRRRQNHGALAGQPS